MPRNRGIDVIERPRCRTSIPDRMPWERPGFAFGPRADPQIDDLPPLKPHEVVRILRWLAYDPANRTPDGERRLIPITTVARYVGVSNNAFEIWGWISGRSTPSRLQCRKISHILRKIEAGRLICVGGGSNLELVDVSDIAVFGGEMWAHIHGPERGREMPEMQGKANALDPRRVRDWRKIPKRRPHGPRVGGRIRNDGHSDARIRKTGKTGTDPV